MAARATTPSALPNGGQGEQFAVHDGGQHRRWHRRFGDEQAGEQVEAVGDARFAPGAAQIGFGDAEVGGGQHVQPGQRLQRGAAPGRQQRADGLGDPQGAREDRVGDRAVLGDLHPATVDGGGGARGPDRCLGGRGRPAPPVGGVLVHAVDRGTRGGHRGGDAGQVEQGQQRIAHPPTVTSAYPARSAATPGRVTRAAIRYTGNY